MKNSAQFDFDSLLASKVRLAIVSALVTIEEAEFTELKYMLNLTQGNLSIHASKLEEAGYIKITKGFVGKKPQTTFKLTERGKQALLGYVNKLKQLIGNV